MATEHDNAKMLSQLTMGIISIAFLTMISMGGWGMLKIIDQGEHLAKIDITLEQQTELMKSNNDFAKSAAVALSELNPEKLESRISELRTRMNALQDQLTEQQKQITDNERTINKFILPIK